MAGYHSTTRQAVSRLRRIARSENPGAYAAELEGLRNHITHVYDRAMGSLSAEERHVIKNVITADPNVAAA